MRCSICQQSLDTDGMVVTWVRGGATYTATIHWDCMRDLVGDSHAKKLRELAFTSGWEQLGLIGFGSPSAQP